MTHHVGHCLVCRGPLNVTSYLRVVEMTPHPDSEVPTEETHRVCSVSCLREHAVALYREAVTVHTDHTADGSRYPFDELTGGYAQLDTTHDAHYYGHWASPSLLKVVSYVEGDIRVIKCRDDAEFCAQVRLVARMECWKAIDPGFSYKLRDKFVELGLGDLLYPLF